MKSVFLGTCLLLSTCVVRAEDAQRPAPKAAPEAPGKAPVEVAAETLTEAPVVSEAKVSAQAAQETTVAALNDELSEVLDGLIAARTRAQLLARSLFRTRIDVFVLRRADEQRLVRVQLGLDGLPVHDSDGSAIVNEEARLYQGHVTPGMHELSIEITEQAKENRSYQYTRTERFRFEVKKDTHNKVEIVLRDDSDMAEELPEGDDGTYKVETRLRVTPKKARD